MSRVKCSKCGRLAHSVVEGKMYCLDCVPKPIIIEETPVNELLIEKMERPKPWPDPPIEYFKPLTECIEKKKPWWKKIIEFFDDRRPK